MIRMMSSVKALTAVIAVTTFTSAALAATTTLTFDELPDDALITNQYQSIGVTVSGARAFLASQGAWSSNTSPNVAYAPSGLMTFTIDSSITGDVKSASAYLSTVAPVGIYAYDANGILVGQGMTTGAVENQLVSVTSSGAPIARVVIHDDGSSFTVDTLKLEAPEEQPVVCQDVISSLYHDIQSLPWQEFKNQPEPRRKALLAQIIALKVLIEADKKIQNKPALLKLSAAAKALLIKNIQKDINDGIKAGPNKTDLLNSLIQLQQFINAKAC